MPGYQFEDFAERYLNVQSITGAEWMCMCLFHDDHNASMQFNVDKGLFTCFSCGVGGSYRKIEKHLGIDHRAPGVGLDVVYRKLNELAKATNRDEGPRVLDETQLLQYRIPTPHWSDRGLNQATVDAFDLGYDIARDAMTIPVRNMHGDLIGITRRFCDPDADLRYKYPKGFKRSEHLYASWMVAASHDSGVVALTEGAIDAMTLWQLGQPAMAFYGSYISEVQIRIMRRLGLTQLMIFADNDKAGKQILQRCRGWKHNNRNQWERCHDLDLRRYFDVTVADWTGISRGMAKDANDLLKRGHIDRAKSMLANPIPL